MSIAIAPKRSSFAANLICLASMLTWAIGLPAAQLVIPLIPPITLTALRSGLAAGVLISAVGIGLVSFASDAWHVLVLYGLVFGAGNGLASIAPVSIADEI